MSLRLPFDTLCLVSIPTMWYREFRPLVVIPTVSEENHYVPLYLDVPQNAVLVKYLLQNREGLCNCRQRRRQSNYTG